SWLARVKSQYRVVLVAARGEEDEQDFWLSLLAAVGAPATPVSPAFCGANAVERLGVQLNENHDPIIIAIDDAHEFSQLALYNIAKFVADLPPHAHVVLSSRRDLRLGTHQLRLAGELTEIRAENLEFTESETRELLARSGITLSNEALRTLQERTEGWAAGLRLAALSLAVDADPEAFVAQFSGSNRVVAEYLMAEMLERQPPDVQRLLLATSILDRVNAELADLLAQTTGSDRILLGLEDANAFVLSLDPERTWFRYHHLFRELLRLELRRTMPEQLAELHRRAAGWFAERAQPIEAIRHIQAAGDWKGAASLLADNLFDLLMDGHRETIKGLLEAFPRSVRAAHPELAVVDAALETMQGRFAEATMHLDVADREVEHLPAERQPAYHVGIATLRLALARRQGHLDSVIEQINFFNTADEDCPVSNTPLSDVLSAVALMNLGIVEMWSGRLPDADEHLREGAELAKHIGQPYIEVTCLANMGFTSKIRSFADALEQSQRAVKLADSYGWENEGAIAPALLTLAGTNFWAGNFAAGEIWLQRSTKVIEPDTNPPVELLFHLVKGMHHVGRRRLGEALTEFEEALRMQSLMIGEHVFAANATAWAAAVKARLGMLDEARALLAAAPPARAASAVMQNAAAAIELESGNPQAALAILSDVLDRRLFIIHDFVLVEANLLAAHAHQKLGNVSEMALSVEKALTLAERDRLIFPFAMTESGDLVRQLQKHKTAHAALLFDIVDALEEAPTRDDRVPTRAANDLSATELRVLRYLPTNLSRSDIARQLYVSVNTVNTHVRNIYSKLGAASRTEAVDRARQLRLLAH
ncbi:MAG TPA: LuxR C-terminal-related transcriptional regulator, partial [Candidatus Acidoferrales bacterium]|nr:LuxR C-terminal-related transcriptional regulator [Candidatus Acidoferrales bacterium]